MSDEVNISAEEDEEFQKLLNDFLDEELKGVETGVSEKKAEEKSAPAAPAQVQSAQEEEETEPLELLKDTERSLYLAYRSFVQSVNKMAEAGGIKPMKRSVLLENLTPNYKPSVGKRIVADALLGWDIMIKTQPTRISSISPTAGDDELLNFAEKTTDHNLTFAIIAYVETVIEIEGCEIEFEKKRLKFERRRVERLIYEEHQKRVERSKRFIAAIEKKKFPINAERLVNNYFKPAQKDNDGAYNALINNPAMFAPIEMEKVKPGFFGLFKVTPKDGFKINQKIADFLKKLKV